MGRGDPARPRGPRRRAAAAGLLAWGALTGSAAAVPLPVPRPTPAAPAPAPPVLEAPTPVVVPLPVPRPETAGPFLPLPLIPSPPDAQAPRGPEAFGPPLPRRAPDPEAPPEPDPACAPLLAGGKVVAHATARVAEGDACGVAAPVTLEAIVLPDGRRAALTPPALMRCDFAVRLADWVRDDVVPVAAAEGGLLGLADAAAYVCRNRNWKAGARVSEHARGNAIDILSFRFARRTVGLKDPGAPALLSALRDSACARFATVLGPGADAFHETDLHLDLEHRRHGFKLCQWTVR